MTGIVMRPGHGRPMIVRRAAGVLLVAALSACGEDAARPPVPDAAAGRSALPTEAFEGRVTSLQRSDHLWATIISARGRPMIAMVGEDPVGLFVHAHRGRLLTLEVETDRLFVAEAGEVREIRRVAGARIGALSAAAWWDGLSPADRAAARRRFHAGGRGLPPGSR